LEVTATKANATILHNAVLLFKLDTGRYPSEEAGLIELVERPKDIEGWCPGGYLKQTCIPQDAWKNEFVYMRNSKGGKPFVIISYGADGVGGVAGNPGRYPGLRYISPSGIFWMPDQVRGSNAEAV
jgi:general secretion pathway protein G